MYTFELKLYLDRIGSGRDVEIGDKDGVPVVPTEIRGSDERGLELTGSFKRVGSGVEVSVREIYIYKII